MSKHKASHRVIRRRGRVGALGLALGVTLAVGGAAVGLLPQLEAEQASADAGATARAAIETASIDTIVIPAPKRRLVTAGVNKVAAVPERSGTGRRIVFDQSDQRVWLIGEDSSVERTYPVSGSRFNNLQPGSYTVQSRTRNTGAFDGSGTMEYFVRFATGFSEPIGFHSVPVDNQGNLEQTKAELGTPLSAGCVRQWKPDAITLWDWAPIGTKVVVTA